jgi:hypothetical protein
VQLGTPASFSEVGRAVLTALFPRFGLTNLSLGESEVRASQPALLAAGRVIAEMRDSLVSQWAEWLEDRSTGGHTIPRATMERELRLLFDIMTEMVGPLRREVNAVWFHACEHYGRIASARGLAAGEVVEELTFFREILIRNLAPVLVAMRARQGLAIMLRLNRVIDKGIAIAVVGYTDALVATLFSQNGVTAFRIDQDVVDVERQLDGLEHELQSVSKQMN